MLLVCIASSFHKHSKYNGILTIFSKCARTLTISLTSLLHLQPLSEKATWIKVKDV